MTSSATATSHGFSDQLRSWRARRRLSQLDLALDAGLSQRHISFLETGRSKPSRRAVAQLGAALDMPAAELDALLQSAGFAARNADARWSPDTHLAVGAAIDHVLQGHAPYPAVAIDRIWTLQKANPAAVQFFMALGSTGQPNLLRELIQPGPVRSSIVNWPDNARALVRLLSLEVARRPNDAEARALLDDLLGQPGVAEALAAPVIEPPQPVLTIGFRIDNVVLNLFSLIATIGMSADASLDDLRIETLLPADETTRRWFENT